jgi:hypothetical protein
VDATDRSQLELLTDKVDAGNKANEEFRTDHEKRVRALERWKFAIPTSALLIIAAFLGGKVN